MTLVRCVFCFAANASEFRFTKKGKPYLTCRVCFTRAFLNRMEALRGAAVCPELIDATVKQVQAGEPSAAWVLERTRTLRQYVTDKLSGVGLPDSGPEPVPFVEDDAKERVA